MKNLFFIVGILFLCQNLHLSAQKIDRETFGTYHYTQLPINPILVNYNTYRVEGEGQYDDPYRRDAVVSATRLSGFTKLNEGANADFIVKVEEYPLQWSESKMNTVTEKVKKDGVETTVTSYNYTQDFTYKYVLKIFTPAGESIYRKDYSGNESIKTGNYAKSSDAYNALKSERERKAAEATSNGVARLCSVVDNEVGFPVKSLQIRSALIKPKKFTYEDYDMAIESFKKGLAIITEKEDAIEAASAEFTPAIEIWEKMLGEANIKDNKARVEKDIATLLYLDIALCYTMMKDYPKAIEYYTKGQELDKNFCSMDDGMRVAQESLKRLNANTK